MGVIMDLRDRKSLREGESSNSSNETENKKACTDCKTTKTPLWRGGPAGPKSLCNACGIRFRKKRRVERGMEKGPEKKKEKTQITSDNANTTVSTTISTTTSSRVAAAAKSSDKVANGNGLISENLRMSLMVLGKKMMLQRSFLVKKQRRRRKRKLGEEEQAAFSLMALSSGSVFAWKDN